MIATSQPGRYTTGSGTAGQRPSHSRRTAYIRERFAEVFDVSGLDVPRDTLDPFIDYIADKLARLVNERGALRSGLHHLARRQRVSGVLRVFMRRAGVGILSRWCSVSARCRRRWFWG